MVLQRILGRSRIIVCGFAPGQPCWCLLLPSQPNPGLPHPTPPHRVCHDGALHLQTRLVGGLADRCPALLQQAPCPLLPCWPVAGAWGYKRPEYYLHRQSSCRGKGRCQQTPSWAPGAQVGAALARAAIFPPCPLWAPEDPALQVTGRAAPPPRRRRQLGPHFRLLFSLAKGSAVVTGAAVRNQLEADSQCSAVCGGLRNFCSTRCVFLVHLGGLDWGCSLEQRWHFGPPRSGQDKLDSQESLGDLLW